MAKNNYPKARCVKMKKYGRKTRDIVFFSAKNQATLCVHTPQARRYAKLLEEDTRIRSYEVNHPLDAAWIARIDRVGIRGAYLQTQWTTDFVITDQDGGEAVREIVTADLLGKHAEIEKLELSRRYWKARDVEDWRLVLTGEAE